MPATKGQLLNFALQLARVNGLTSEATPEQRQDLLMQMEWKAANLDGQQNRLGWISESDPEDESDSNIPDWAVEPFCTLFTKNVFAYYGLPTPPEVTSMVKGSISVLTQRTLDMTPTNRPNTMPLGNGQTFRYRYPQRYYRSLDNIQTGGDNLYDSFGEVVSASSST